MLREFITCGCCGSTVARLEAPDSAWGPQSLEYLVSEPSGETAHPGDTTERLYCRTRGIGLHSGYFPFHGFLAASCGGFRAGGAFWNHITWVTAAPAHSWQAGEATVLAEYSSALWQVKQWQVSSQKQNDVLFILQSISRKSPAGVEAAWDGEQHVGARTRERTTALAASAWQTQDNHVSWRPLPYRIEENTYFFLSECV